MSVRSKCQNIALYLDLTPAQLQIDTLYYPIYCQPVLDTPHVLYCHHRLHCVSDSTRMQHLPVVPLLKAKHQSKKHVCNTSVLHTGQGRGVWKEPLWGTKILLCRPVFFAFCYLGTDHYFFGGRGGSFQGRSCFSHWWAIPCVRISFIKYVTRKIESTSSIFF